MNYVFLYQHLYLNCAEIDGVNSCKTWGPGQMNAGISYLHSFNILWLGREDCIQRQGEKNRRKKE